MDWEKDKKASPEWKLEGNGRIRHQEAARNERTEGLGPCSHGSCKVDVAGCGEKEKVKATRGKCSAKNGSFCF